MIITPRYNGIGILIALTVTTLCYLEFEAVRAGLFTSGKATMSLILVAIWLLNGQLYSVFGRFERVTFGLQFLIIILINAVIVGIGQWLMPVEWLPQPLADDTPRHVKLFLRLYLGVLGLAVPQFILISLYRQKTLLRQNEQLRSERLFAELEGLKQEIIPHFLFNALGLLRVMIRENDEQAESYVLRLSATYRQFLSKRTAITTSVAEEIELMENYLSMVQFRLEGLRFRVDTSVSEERAHLPIFCLQQLVANCVKHNTVSPDEPLTIWVYQRQPTTITVENNKQLKLRGVESMGIDLDNIRKRYALLGLPEGVIVQDTDSVFAVTVTLLTHEHSDC